MKPTDIACPKCGAAAGICCVTPNAYGYHSSSYHHAERVDAAFEQLTAPLPLGKAPSRGSDEYRLLEQMLARVAWRDVPESVRIDMPGGVDACWPWTGSKNKAGYGGLRLGSLTDGTRRMVAAHRLSYELHVGPLTKTDIVMHRCDNPSCVNPRHLRKGTQSDNIQDCLRKGRFRTHDAPRRAPPPKRGEANPRAKLSASAVAKIREAARAGEAVRSIGRRFGVSGTHVARIARGEYWK